MKREIVFNLLFLIFFIFLSICFISKVDAGEAAQSGYSLIGTVQSGGLTGAVIAVAKDEQSFFRKFDKLPDGSQIIEVRTDEILLRRTDGTTYKMYILHGTKTASSVQRDVPADSSAPEALRNIPAQRPPDSYVNRQSRPRRQSSHDE